MLSERQQETLSYLEHRVNKITRTANEKIWLKNIYKNKPLYIKGNPVPRCFTSYLVAAGPSLNKNVEELKNVSPRGTIVAVDACYSFLTEKGIQPEYCVSLDASNKIFDMVKDKLETTKDCVLVANTASNPKLVKAWKGPIFFFSSIHPHIASKTEEFYAVSRYAVAKKDIKKGDELVVNKNYSLEFPGVLIELPCGGNVTTTAHAFCLNQLKSTQVVFVGHDFSWTDAANFYAGGKFFANVKNRICNEDVLTHLNLAKEKVNTNFSMHSFKLWHEQVAIQYPYTSINATEGGILGVNEKGECEIGWDQMTLKEAISKFTPKE